jgi:hypothetical protein
MAGPALTGGGQGTPAPAATKAPATAHGVVVELIIELVGVGLMGIFAGMGEGIGRLMLTLMVGFFIIWFLLNASEFAAIVKKV